jgi:hypothetical protein
MYFLGTVALLLGYPSLGLPRGVAMPGPYTHRFPVMDDVLDTDAPSPDRSVNRGGRDR